MGIITGLKSVIIIYDTFQAVKFLIVLRLGLFSIVIYYHWVHAKETGETGTAVQSVPVGSVFMILGMAILFARKAREFSKSNKLAGECKEVKSELDKTKLDYMKCKEAVEIKLPEQKKRFRVEGLKCKKD